MIQTEQFGHLLSELKFNFYSGVPCSFLKDLINYAINEEDFIMAANEGDALAICAGAHLGGKKTVFLCQNSGLTNAVSPLTSLNYTFEIPVLGFVSLRGEEGLGDEPQHELMGKITSDLLTTMQVKHEVLSSNIEEVKEQLERANDCIKHNESYFFIVKKNTFGKVPLKKQEMKRQMSSENEIIVKEAVITRLEALHTLQQMENKDILLLATTGVTGRELFELGDFENQFYMVGSMGCIASIGLGLARALPNKKVIVIDGDGSLLMRLGSLATNGYYHPKNLFHLLLDNESHESTGGQNTVSSNMNFPQIAKGAGYRQIISVSTQDELQISVLGWIKDPKLTFSYMKIKKGTKPNLGRPTITPIEVKNRFMKICKEDYHE